MTLSWEATFRPLGSAEDVRQEFLKRVRSLGFEQTDGDLVTHLRGLYQRIVDRGDSVAQHTQSLRRKAGDDVEEIVVRGLEGGLIGGKYDVEIELVWAISTETNLPVPTFAQLFKACPLLRPPHSEDKVDAVLADEPVYAFRLRYGRKPMYSDWKATVPAKVQPRIEAALERQGFKPGRTHELRPPQCPEGTTQFTWDRMSNATFVHLIPIVEEGRLKLLYQPPQRWYVYFRYYRADVAHPAPTLSYYPGLSIYSDVKRLGGTTYDLYVVVEPAVNSCISHATLKSWIASPRTLRDTGLAWMDRISAEIEKQIRSGAAVRRAYVVEEEAFNRRDAFPDGIQLTSLPARPVRQGSPPIQLASAVPPEKQPPLVQPSDRKMTKQEQDEVIREAQEKIEQQRQLLRENCEEMHAALLKAFPLLAYLDESR